MRVTPKSVMSEMKIWGSVPGVGGLVKTVGRVKETLGSVSSRIYHYLRQTPGSSHFRKELLREAAAAGRGKHPATVCWRGERAGHT